MPTFLYLVLLHVVDIFHLSNPTKMTMSKKNRISRTCRRLLEHLGDAPRSIRAGCRAWKVDHAGEVRVLRVIWTWVEHCWRFPKHESVKMTILPFCWSWPMSGAGSASGSARRGRGRRAREAREARRQGLEACTTTRRSSIVRVSKWVGEPDNALSCDKMLKIEYLVFSNLNLTTKLQRLHWFGCYCNSCFATKDI